MRTAINAAIISARRILLVQKNETWILPGGKPEEGEEDSACLGREFGEELSGTQLENLSYYGEFEGRTPHTGDVLAAKVYFADIKGELGRPSSEIKARRWFRGNEVDGVSDITSKIIEALKDDDYL